jgi:acetyltransferase-like isoleucine patch superfamily enzyme
MALGGAYAVRSRSRRNRFVRKVRRTAWLVGATVELELAPDLVVGKDITVEVTPGSRNKVVLGPGSSIEDRVLLILQGGSLLGGPRIEIRRDVVLNISGTLRMESDNPISWGSVVHCSNDIHFEPMAGVAEHCTLADSSHYFTTPDEHFWHNIRSGRIHIGRNTWICPKVTLTRTADVGAHCIVAAGSVVVGAVPDGHLASGVPAQVSKLALPWEEARSAAQAGGALA